MHEVEGKFSPDLPVTRWVRAPLLSLFEPLKRGRRRRKNCVNSPRPSSEPHLIKRDVTSPRFGTGTRRAVAAIPFV